MLHLAVCVALNVKVAVLKKLAKIVVVRKAN